ncbi:MAG: polysaccharide biosynthesis protein [bacterium]|nr:polysaccharide biosynthesis protein [bacterium]
MTLLKEFLVPTKLKRVVFFILLDILLIAFSFYFSFYLRFGFTFPDKYFPRTFYWIGPVILIKLAALLIFSVYKLNWRFVSIMELGSLTKSFLLCTTLLYAGNMIISKYLITYNLPRGMLLIDAIFGFGLIGFLRISKRFALEFFTKGGVGKRALIIGADVTSERLIKEIKSAKPSKLFPVAYVDENRTRTGTTISGLPVLGGFDQIGEIIKEDRVDSVLINLPRASHKKISEIFNMVTRAGVDDIKIVPHVDEFNKNVNVVKDFKNLDIDDLLARASVKVNYEDIGNFLRDKSIMVSGAAGSIGSEICRKLVQFGVKHIIGYEIDETEVFNLQFELNKLARENQTINLVVGDVRDREKLDRVMGIYHPDIIFHASAYKHVPLMEAHPEEAIKTNVLGSLNLAELAVK